MSKKNPFSIIESVLRITGRVFLVGLTVLLFVFMIVVLWENWGAWALTLPIIVVGGFLASIFISIAIADGFAKLQRAWYRAERDYERKHNG